MFVFASHWLGLTPLRQCILNFRRCSAGQTFGLRPALRVRRPIRESGLLDLPVTRFLISVEGSSS
jgi:hypothetical protein